MTNSDNNVIEVRPGDREVDGLVSEQFLREWLQNLETLIEKRDRANAKAAARARRQAGGKYPPLQAI